MDLHLDPWAPLNRWLNEPYSPGSYPGVWIPKEDRRRIQAYTLLKSVETNNFRDVLPLDDDTNPAAMSEWGEASLFVQRVVAGLLSRTITFIVEGSRQPPPPVAPLPDEINPPETDDPIAVAAYEAAVRVRQETAAAAIEDWEQAHTDHRNAVLWQRWWDEWAEKEQWLTKLFDAERQYVVPLGDGVLVHAWDSTLNRPTVHVVDPAEYFPVLDPDDPRWPSRVHRAWESTRERTDGTSEQRLHRVTWSTYDLEQPRQLPWNTAPTTTAVSLTERWWPADRAGTWNQLDEDRAIVVKDLPDTGLDFVPVVHIPNTAETVHHYGQSILANHLGLFETIARHNHNLALAGDLAAFPAFVATGVQVKDVGLYPGAVLSVGAGEIEPLDLGPTLKPLMDLGDWFMNRASVVTQVGKPILGISDPGDAGSSGVKLRLQHVPFEQLIESLRPIRARKYALSAKMVMRLALHGGLDVPDGPPPRMLVDFGPVTPADLKAVIDDVKALADDISPETKVAMLQAAGIPIDSIADEVARLDRRDIEFAVGITEATGDLAAAARHLEIRLSEPTDPAASEPAAQ